MAGMKDKSKSISYHSDGQIASKTTYLSDGVIKEEERYFENGQLKEKWTEKNKKKEGSYFSFFANGQLQEKAFFKNGRLHGMQKIFHEDGQAASKKNFLNGQEEGRHTEFYGKSRHIKYYYKGKLYREEHYLHKNKHGWEIEYFLNGSIRIRKHWKNGELDGDFELFNGRTRKLKYKIGLKNGKHHGKEIHYEKSGEITTCEWKNGVRDGVAFKYNAQEQPLLKLIYKNGLILEAFNLTDVNKKDKNLAEANAFIAAFINYQNYKTLKK